MEKKSFVLVEETVARIKYALKWLASMCHLVWVCACKLCKGNWIRCHDLTHCHFWWMRITLLLLRKLCTTICTLFLLQSLLPSWKLHTSPSNIFHDLLARNSFSNLKISASVSGEKEKEIVSFSKLALQASQITLFLPFMLMLIILTNRRTRANKIPNRNAN